MRYFVIIVLVGIPLCIFSQSADSLSFDNKTSIIFDNNLIKKEIEKTVVELIEYCDTSDYGKYILQKYKSFPVYIYDIQDTSINSVNLKGDIDFVENHIYHFSSFEYSYLYSNVLVVCNDSIAIFRALNCSMVGETYDDLKKFLIKLGFENTELLIQKVKNFKDYTVYWKTDNYSKIKCR